MRNLYYRLLPAIAGRGALLAALFISDPVSGIEVKQPGGTAHAYPEMLDLSGKMLANGEFTQEVKDGLLAIQITYALNEGDTIEEKGKFRQRSELRQSEWSWRELKGDILQREYKVDFNAGIATVRKREEEGLKDWSEQLEIEPGRTFAGFGFTLALQNLRDRLVKAETIEPKAVGFTPQPRVVGVKLTYHGIDRVRMSGRTLRGEHYIIHPEIPAIARLFMKITDTHIWLTPPPAGFLRWEGPLAEPGDQIVRFDLASGGESGLAKPVEKE